MLRDNLKGQKYFEEYISYETSRIKKFAEVLKEIDDTEKASQCKIYIAGFYKNKLIAMYSAGYSIEDMKGIFNEYIEYISAIDSYSELVDLLSLAILFNYDKPLPDIIMNNGQYDDALVRLLKGYFKNKKTDISSEDLKYPEVYAKYLDILSNESEDAAKQLTQFLNDEWYSLNKDMAWYDSHKNDNNIYNGYWCWLGAAICQIKQIPKELLDNCKYLPIDLI